MRVLLSQGAWYLCFKKFTLWCTSFGRGKLLSTLSLSLTQMIVIQYASMHSPSVPSLVLIWDRVERRSAACTPGNHFSCIECSHSAQYRQSRAKWSASAMGIQSAMTKLEQTLADWMRCHVRGAMFRIDLRTKLYIFVFVLYMVDGDFICKIRKR